MSVAVEAGDARLSLSAPKVFRPEYGDTVAAAGRGRPGKGPARRLCA